MIYLLMQLHSLHAYCQQKLLQVYNFRGKRFSLTLSLSVCAPLCSFQFCIVFCLFVSLLARCVYVLSCIACFSVFCPPILAPMYIHTYGEMPKVSLEGFQFTRRCLLSGAAPTTYLSNPPTIAMETLECCLRIFAAPYTFSPVLYRNESPGSIRRCNANV